jgi:hypothetical protein
MFFLMMTKPIRGRIPAVISPGAFAASVLTSRPSPVIKVDVMENRSMT